MKVGMNMLLWTTHVTEDHYPLLADIKATGFDGVEIPVSEGKDEDYIALRQELDRLGLECTTVTSVLGDDNPTSADPAAREGATRHMVRALRWADILGSNLLCGPYHSAYAVFSGQPPTDDELKRSAEWLAGIAQRAEAQGVTLAAEYLNRFECYLVNTAEQTRDYLALVGHPTAGMLYDTHHAHFEERSVRDAITKSAKELKHIHISENDRGVPGTGQVAWRETFSCLKEIGYDSWLVIESFSRLMPDFATAVHIWRDYFDSPEQVYREGHGFIREMWAET